jgi:hypothetical protein
VIDVLLVSVSVSVSVSVLGWTVLSGVRVRRELCE